MATSKKFLQTYKNHWPPLFQSINSFLSHHLSSTYVDPLTILTFSLLVSAYCTFFFISVMVGIYRESGLLLMTLMKCSPSLPMAMSLHVNRYMNLWLPSGNMFRFRENCRSTLHKLHDIKISLQEDVAKNMVREGGKIYYCDGLFG